MKKRLLALLMAAAMMMATAACGSETTTAENNTTSTTEQTTEEGGSEEAASTEESTSTESNDTFTVAISYMPDSLSPQTGGSDDYTSMTRPLFDHLFLENIEGGLDYYLADSLEVSEDGLTYTVHLREDATWSDGTPITTADVQFVADLTLDLFGTPGDAALLQVVRGHLHRHLVAGQNPDEIHSELSGNMRQNRVSISNVDLERGVGQGLDDHALHFNHVGFCQTLSLLARILLPAEGREGFAKLAVGDALFAADLLAEAARPGGDEAHVALLLPLGALGLALFAVRQQEVLAVHVQNEEELSLVPAGFRPDDVCFRDLHAASPVRWRAP